MRRLSGLFVVMVVIAGFIILNTVTVASAKDIRVGSIINLTGPASTWGQFHAKGHKDYFRYVNEVKGGVYGNKLDLTIVDHAYKVPEALKYIKRFCTEDKMDMTATWDAGSGIMAKPIIQKYKMPNINYSTYQAILKPPVDYAYVVMATFDRESWAILEYIKNIHKGSEPPKVGLLTYNNAYGRAIHASSKEYAAKYNVNIVGIEEFPTKTLDLNTEMLRLKDKGAEYVFLQMLPSAAIMAFKAADRINFDCSFFGCFATTDPNFFKRGKGLIRDRMQIQFPGCVPGDGSEGMKLLEELWKRYKSVSKFDTSYWLGVTVAAIMHRAFLKAHEKFGKIDSETINQALETFRNEDFGGLVPDITYTKTDHSASFKTRIIKVHEDGTFTPLTNHWQPGKEKIQILR